MTVKSKSSRRTWRDPDDAPQITDKWIAEANLYHGKKLVRRGRPAGSGQKTQTTVRISKDVLEFFRATGPGWQTRLDNALKRYVASQRRRGEHAVTAAGPRSLPRPHGISTPWLNFAANRHSTLGRRTSDARI